MPDRAKKIKMHRMLKDDGGLDNGHDSGEAHEDPYLGDLHSAL